MTDADRPSHHPPPPGDLGATPADAAAREPDERVFDRYRAGEREAIRTLVERYHDDLIRFLYRMSGDRQTAEDLFQETFLQVHASQHTFDSSRRFKPWLFTIAANKCRDALRKRSRRSELELSAPLRPAGGGESGAAFVDLMKADVPGPGAEADREERDRMVQRAIGRLSPALREILLLAYFQRLSYAQIAEDLGIPLGTVKSRLHSAVGGFAAAWREVSEERDGGARGPETGEKGTGT